MRIYQDNVQKYTAEISSLDKDLKQLSALRLIVFVFSVTLLIVLANERSLPLMLVIIPMSIAVFAMLVKRYNEVEQVQRYTGFLKAINEQEILRQENKLSGFPSGQEFIERDHPYVSDLDIFGQHSLFQLVNRTTNESGHLMLAEWLSAPAANEVILERQQAVKELAPLVAWRQDFQAAGMGFTYTKVDYDKLLHSIEKPIQVLPYQLKYLVISIVLSLFSTAATIYFFSHVLTVTSAEQIVPYLIPLIISLLVNNLVLRKGKDVAEETTHNIHHHIRILNGFKSLITKIDSVKFHSEKLNNLQSFFRHENYSVVKEISNLKETLEVFKLRGRKREFNHFFYSVANALWFLDIYLIILTEKWKYKHARHLKVWASAMSEFEVLASIAGMYYSNPSFTFPEITDDPYSINFENLGHPLIDQNKRVCNTFSLNGRGKIAMITGSNMAGKSTFLRTVGVNLVLALMGAPCCATSGEVSNIKIFSSMRTQDNLNEGVSSFYAELKRIEHLLKLIESGRPIFFFLDEMFKGTNSADRHQGGFSLIKQLKELNAFGLISTHDLDLATLAAKHSLVTNYSFNSTIKETEMVFTYALTDGLCLDFNASELMKKSGIKILTHIDEAPEKMI